MLPIYLAFALCGSTAFAEHIEVKDHFKILSPEKEHLKTNTDVVEYLVLQHYRNLEFDNRLSSLVFDRYIKELDKNHYYFIESDIKQFEKFRFELDEALTTANLDTAFLIFNRFQRRHIERLAYIINTIDHQIENLDFTKEESLEVDRENSLWAKNTAELDTLWRRNLKNTVLNKKLNDKPIKEIKDALLKRYKSQLNRVSQTKPEDAFRIYMKALTQTFDPHSEYFSPRASENFNIHMSLSLEGIGAVLTSDNEYTKVVRLIAKGPADKGGQLKPGDKITGVAQGNSDFISVIGSRLDDVVAKIRGPKGTTVRLEVISGKFTDGRSHIVSIKRDKVKLEDKEAKKEILEVTANNRVYKIGVIDLPTFYIDFEGSKRGDPNYKSTTRDVKKLIQELKNEHVDGIVIDLRNNGGGSLQEANQLVGLFIKKGPTVQIRDYRSAIGSLEDKDNDIFYTGPMAVLVNRLSASASEIFAGAIQDYKRGIIIGSQTFGKGTVQALLSMNKGQLKITHAMFFRVSGASTQNRGVIPDVVFPTRFDKEDIGESALPRALPWSKIPPAKHVLFPDFASYLPTLRDNHQNRVKNDPAFNLLIEEIEKLRQLKEKKEISLNESVRRKERTENDAWQLSLENKKRKLLGKAPLKELEKKDDDDIAKEEDDDKDKLDPILTETGNVLVDLIQKIDKH